MIRVFYWTVNYNQWLFTSIHIAEQTSTRRNQFLFHVTLNPVTLVKSFILIRLTTVRHPSPNISISISCSWFLADFVANQAKCSYYIGIDTRNAALDSYNRHTLIRTPPICTNVAMVDNLQAYIKEPLCFS